MNAGANEDAASSAAGLTSWVSISELARIRGVSKVSISKRVARLEALGALATRPGERGTKLVSLAQFAFAINETRDAVRSANGAGRDADASAPSPGNRLVYSREQARQAAFRADLLSLELDQKRGEILPLADVEAAMARCGLALVRVIDAVPSRAEELADAVAKAGAAGARTFLRDEMRKLRERLAAELRVEAGAAGDNDRADADISHAEHGAIA